MLAKLRGLLVFGISFDKEDYSRVGVQALELWVTLTCNISGFFINLREFGSTDVPTSGMFGETLRFSPIPQQLSRPL